MARRKLEKSRRKAFITKMVSKYAKQFHNRLKRTSPQSTLSVFDFIQEGFIIAERCKESYDPERGYFYPLLKKGLIRRFSRVLLIEREICNSEMLIGLDDNYGDLRMEEDKIIPNYAERREELKDQVTMLQGDAKVIYELLLNLPRELMRVVQKEGTLYGKEIAKYLRKGKHGSNWNSARVSLAKKVIRNTLF